MDSKEREQKKEEFPKLYKKWRNIVALEEFLELGVVAGAEDILECSGFCKPALFYWERDIYSGGYPE